MCKIVLSCRFVCRRILAASRSPGSRGKSSAQNAASRQRKELWSFLFPSFSAPPRLCVKLFPNKPQFP